MKNWIQNQARKVSKDKAGIASQEEAVYPLLETNEPCRYNHQAVNPDSNYNSNLPHKNVFGSKCIFLKQLHI